MFSLKGRTALITGATGGIGRSVVTHLVQAECNVVASGTNKQKLDALAKEVPGIYVEKMECDLGSKQSLDFMFEQALTAFDGIDILVCNAGVTSDALILRLKEDELERVMSINFNAVFRLNQLAAKHMVRKQYGRIINISSVVAHTGNIGQSNYAASKAAVEGMSRSLAQELATRNITVNCIAPGFIDTNMTAHLPSLAQEALLSKIPMQRMGSADEVAPCVVFLASEAASYITGTTIHINGGLFNG